jgi:broad specificity phosphatase PhoE
MKIIFEPHATTIDNEAHLASGWNDIALSQIGKTQAQELGARYRLDDIDVVFTSDLQRAYQTALLAFPGIQPRKLRLDWRLRECDYGDFTQKSKALVDTQKPERIQSPFAGGESYEDTVERMRSFLLDISKMPNHQTVMIIGHRATQYGLEHLLNGLPLQATVRAPWSWQPGWAYELSPGISLSKVA